MSSKKDAWANWDRAWDLNITAEQRLAALKDALHPNFTYSNPRAMAEVKDGKFEELVQLIQTLMTAYGNKLVVKHINWYEHHGQSALQWDMIDQTNMQVAISGWSYGQYNEESGKLVRVTDFWKE